MGPGKLEPELREVSAGVYACLQPDGSWYLNNTGFLVSSTAQEAKAAGMAPLEAARQADLGEFKDLLDSERIVGNLHRAYLELDGAGRGAPADLARALGEMVAYNGGHPLTCHA
jgi:cyclase